jgi:D-serine deaminase-like pyridoxal phosphate-dependent protein
MKTRFTTRRGFLQTGAMGAADISKWDLDTPALCVDLDKLEQNLARMRAAVRLKAYRNRGVKVLFR